jgi:glycosyltransferase involved in cell wall biosynthesis
VTAAQPDKPRVETGAAHPPAPVRVLLVADAQSPTTWGWVDAIRSAGVVVLGADGLPWPGQQDIGTGGADNGRRTRQRLRSLAGATPGGLTVIAKSRRVAGPLLAPVKGRRLRRVVERVRPDVVHGLRIPYEAMAAVAACPPGVPMAVSIWGNDLTHEALTSRRSSHATRGVLTRADLLFADCQRDIDLARTWGLPPSAVTAVVPGGGGIDFARMAEGARIETSQLGRWLGPDCRLIVNPRGARPYVRNDVLLEALSLIATGLDPRVRVVFADAAHDATLRHAVQRHRLRNKIVVLGKCSPGEMLSLFGQAEVSVSITDQDGTPNSMLEAMAAGVVPVCSDLPSIREWIEPARNGFLATFNDPHAVAGALRLALGLSDAGRAAIRAENARIIAARAERGSSGMLAAQMYRALLMRRETPAPATLGQVS